MKLIIEDDEGRKTVVPLVREEITIGRQDGNTIRLTERNVSRRHARLVKDNGTLLIEDLGSYNGVRVNGDRIQGPTKVKEGDLIEIGDYDLGIQGKLETPLQQAPITNSGTKVPKAVAAAAATSPAKVPTPPAPVAAAPAAEAAAAPEAQSAGGMGSASAGGATAIIRVSDIMKSQPQVEAQDLAKNQMPRLVGLSGPVRGKEFYLMRTDVKVGRTEENDIGIDHQSMSRQHCRFVLEASGWKVYDNKSANGVRINGEEYAVSAVKPGDTIELGHLKFRFCGPGEKFTLPPEKTEGAAERPSGPRPTTAELIAGASAPRAAAAPAAKKSNLGVIIGAAVGALVLVGVVLFFVLGKKGPADGGADAIIKKADAAFKQHKYIAANDLYNEAIGQGENPPNQKKAEAEAKGEEVYNDLEAAITAGNFDKAKTLAEKCATESTYWCTKSSEKTEAVKGGYAKVHLAKANAAKAAGNAALCTSEVNLVLAYDPSNGDAQSLSAQCNPQAAVDSTPKPKADTGPSQSQRDAKASGLITEGNAKFTAHDFDGAMAKYNDAVAQKPSKNVLGLAYRGLGTAAANKGDTKGAVKWFKLYLPYCDPPTKAAVQNIIDKYSAAGG